MPEHEDDPSVGNDELLWRRVLPEWIHRDDKGNCRPQSLVFVDRLSGELSVHIARLTTLEEVVNQRPRDSVVQIKAGDARSLGYAIVAVPTSEDCSHALVCPSPTKRHAKLLARSAVWVLLREP